MDDDLEPVADAAADAPPEQAARWRARRLSPLTSVVVVGMLAVIAGLLVLNLLAVRTLTTETRRSSCYQRLAFIGRPDNPAEVPGAARLCDGDTPLVQYSDE